VGGGKVREHERYYFKDEKQLTILYEFDTEEEMNESGLLNDPRRTACFESGGKYYVGGHFKEMKKVYICSRYRADDKHSVEDNIKTALYACRCAAQVGFAPYAPHLYLPQCLDDNDPAERAAGIRIGQEFLKSCDEVWQWGATVSAGMAAELALAKELGIPIKVFNSIGIPHEQWNSVKFAGVPEYEDACKKAGTTL
jgi:hypothetical protein